MWKSALGLFVLLGTVGCGGISQAEAGRQVDQLMVLYKENRPKFVVQKRELEVASSCDRATALRQAIDSKAATAAMSPDKDETVTLVKMELEQAEKSCLTK